MREYIKNNIAACSVAIFVIVFISLHIYHPLWLYNRDGSLRQFGIGYRNKTILPMWLLSIVLGILIYVGVLTWLAIGSL